MEVKLRKKTLEEKVDQLIFDVAVLKVQYQKLYDILSETKIDDSKITYLKCYLPTRCEHLLRGKYCEDKCVIEGCIRDSLSTVKKEE